MEMKLTRSVLGLCCAVLAAAMLSACGNGPEASNALGGLPVAKQLALALVARVERNGVTPADPTTSPDFRVVLEKAGTPFYRVAIPKINSVVVMAPFGQNGNVETWSSANRLTMSVKDGILVATRGYGPDLMTAVAPDVAQVKAGRGTFHRVYYYLDGADQPQSLAFDCSYAPSGTETVNLLGLAYATHRVIETCSNATSHIENNFWFDGNGKLRQSDQFMSPQTAYMRLQRIID